MAIRLWTALVVALTAGCVADEQSPVQAGPPIPYEDVGACPFEGCVYREWVANAPVEIRTDRTLTAPVAFAVGKGEKVTAVNGVVITTRPGRVEFDAPHDVDASGGRIHIESGQSLYLLTSQGAAGPRPCVGRIVEPWQSEWWVQIRNAAGKVGWTREPGKFDNKDALG